jgi:hypothetical protein
VPIVIAVVAAAVVLALVFVAVRTRGGSRPQGAGEVTVEATRLRPSVAEFHVSDGSARVHFEVPLPGEGADEVLTELLGREAVEVVREKRHTLPIDDVHRVVALGRRGPDWSEVATIDLDTPGELPPPMLPELIPHAAHHDFDPFEKLSELPQQAPGLASVAKGEELGGLALRLPAAASAGLRAQGVDPVSADAPSSVIGLMSLAGYAVTDAGPDTFSAIRAGERTLVRVVPHRAGGHPELSESEIRKFVVDFGASGSSRGLLITEKYSPFEIYERERRDPRVRFITRERLQAFADALAIG